MEIHDNVRPSAAVHSENTGKKGGVRRYYTAGSVHRAAAERGRGRKLPTREKKNAAQTSGTDMSAKTQVMEKGAEPDAKPVVKPDKTVKIIPLGGLEEIGINMTAFEYEGTIIVVDCGISFPGNDEPGVDVIIPDTAYLKDHASQVKGLFITHGHEDHIGAIPYVEQELKIPVYGTRLTMAIIENKLEQHKMKTKVKRNVVKFGQKVTVGPFKVEYVKTSHSIQDSAALAISTPAGMIIHTGDFKVDHTPVFGDPINLARFAQLGQEGVLAMLCDSTNAQRPGSTMPEKSVGKVLDDLFMQYKGRRILIATFASNVDRVQQIINAAYKSGKKAVIDGRSMLTIMDIATRLGYITLPENTVIDMEDIDQYDEGETVVIMTGSQGEEMSSLTRVSKGKHARILAKPGDVVIFSSHPIPGNEKSVNEVVNAFLASGIEVVMQDVHVSGHACADDIRLLYSLVKPQFAVPVHGDFRQRIAQQHIVESLDYNESNIRLIRSGDILEVGDGYAEVAGTVKSGRVMVDKNTVGNVGNIVINERKRMSNDGIVVVTILLDKQYTLLQKPEIICRGFVYVRGSKPLIDKMHTEVFYVMKSALDACKRRNLPQEEAWDLIKCRIRESLEGFLWEEVKGKPIILPIILEV